MKNVFSSVFEWFKEAFGEVWEFIDEMKGFFLFIAIAIFAMVVGLGFLASLAESDCERNPESKGCVELEMQKKTYGTMLDKPLTKRDALILFQELKQECQTNRNNGGY